MKGLEALKMRQMYTDFLSPIRITVYIISKWKDLGQEN